MAYCLLARDRAAGTVTVLSPASFERVTEATLAARDLVISEDVDPQSTEILIVDVSTAARVEFITLEAPVVEPAPEDLDLAPAAGVWETPADVPEPTALVEEAESESEPALGLAPEPELEIEPEPVFEAAEAEPLPRFAFAPERESAPSGLELEPEPLAASVADEVAVPAPRPEPDLEPMPEPSPEPAPAPEPAPTPAPLPWPEPAMEPEIAEASPAPAEEPAPAEPVVITEVTIVEALPVVELDVGPYEVSGELILERYTCDDCVYANTCPKVGESAPAECGSFQWKSV